MRALSLIAVLLLGSPAVHAANWFALDTLSAAGGLVLEVDTDSLHQAGARREITVRVSYPEPRLHPRGASFRSVVATVELECEDRLADLRDAVFYSAAGGHGMVTTREEGRLAATSESTGDLLPARNVELLIRAACSRPTPAVP